MYSNVISITNVHLFHINGLNMWGFQAMLVSVRLFPSLFPLSKNMNISFIRGKCVPREWATGVCPTMDWSLIHLIVCFVLSHYSGASGSRVWDHQAMYQSEQNLQCCSNWTLWGQLGSPMGKGINSTGPNTGRFYTTSTRTVWRLKLLWTLMKTAWVKQSIPS